MRPLNLLPKAGMFTTAIGVSLAAIALSSCSVVDNEPPPVPPAFEFGAAAPFVIAAQSIEIVEEFRPTLLPPNVEHEYATPPAAVAMAWGQRRLSANGGSGTMRYIIRDASLVQRDLETASGWRARMIDEADIELSARLEVVIEYEGPTGETTARAVVAAKSTSYESASLTDMDRSYFEMLEEMATELDTAFTEQFDGELSQILAAP